MISSGIWNTITRLGNILSGNLDLLIVNLYLSATDMGILAISKMIPNLLNTITGILASIFMTNFLELFAKKMFGDKVVTKFRPHHFPFTEPSVEVDISCHHCGGKGCAMCKETGWIEILGCGMVHPNVLRNCGIDPDVFSGFAFGFGVDRMVMLKYGIDDIRALYESDMRFLNQF